MTPHGAAVRIIIAAALTLARLGRAAFLEPQQVVTLAGSGSPGFEDGTGTAASFRSPFGVAAAADGSALFISDQGNHAIRWVSFAQVGNYSADLTATATLAGHSGRPGFTDGVGAAARFSSPAGLALTPDGATLYVVDRNNSAVRAVATASGAVATLLDGRPSANGGAGLGGGLGPLVSPGAAALHGGVLYLCDSGGAGGGGRVLAVAAADPSLVVEVALAGGGLAEGVRQLAAAPDGRSLYVADTGNGRVAQVDLATGAVAAVGAGGSGAAPLFPGGLAGRREGAAAAEGDEAFGHRVWEVALASGRAAVLAGSGAAGLADGTGAQAAFRGPAQLAAVEGSFAAAAAAGAAAGVRLQAVVFVADMGNHALRAVGAGGGGPSPAPSAAPVLAPTRSPAPAPTPLPTHLPTPHAPTRLPTPQPTHAACFYTPLACGETVEGSTANHK